MIVEHFSVAPLGCNCVVLGDELSGTALVIDPGGEVPRILATLRKHKLRCIGIAHTHTHFDHVGGTQALQEETGAPVMMHHDDLFLYQGLQMQLDAFGVPFRAPPVAEVDRFLRDGDALAFGHHAAEVMHTPGHTPGSLCFWMPQPTLTSPHTEASGQSSVALASLNLASVTRGEAQDGSASEEDSPEVGRTLGGRESAPSELVASSTGSTDHGTPIGTGVVLAGDTLFCGSIGRSDLWGGDGATLIQSIRKRLLTLPDETVVITGHGPLTTVGEERRNNPYLR